MIKIFLFCVINICLFANELKINILYLEQIIKKPPVLSNIIEEPTSSGLSGAKLAIKDSNRTARFFNQKYILKEIVSKDENLLIKTFEEFIKNNNSYVLLNVEDKFLKKLISHTLANKALFINVASTSSSLRKNICQDNLLHTIASDAMLYDGLVQFLIKRNWKKWLLISGTNNKDRKIQEAIKRAAKRFGGKIIDEKIWSSNSDIRRKAQDEIPSFTQSKDYDVVLVADYYGDFGEHIYFNTWLPRPLAGTQGLRPVTWHKVIEAWGAAQLQKRFEKFANRWMNSKDYASWVAIRTIVGAISKTKTKELNTNIKFIYSKDFDLGAYKGRKLTYRTFNGQLRQAIPLVHPRALVSTSPQFGFLHQKTDLDTLGLSKYEISCIK